MSMFRRRLLMQQALRVRPTQYPGLIAAWDIEKEGKNNQSEDRLYARDLTGNRHDIQWMNVAFNEEGSGYKDGAMYLDGVNDFGVANIINNFKNGITLIAKRKYLNGVETPKAQAFTAFGDDTGLGFFTSESTIGGLQGWFVLYNGSTTNIGNKIIKDDIIFINNESYNGVVNIAKGSNRVKDSKYFRIGRLTSNDRYTKLAFYSAYLFDRSLDEQEIKEFIRKHIDKDYVLPSEQP